MEKMRFAGFALASALFVVACEQAEQNSTPATTQSPSTAPVMPEANAPVPAPTQPVSAGPVKGGEAMKVAYILWGGEAGMLMANGGLRTTVGSTMDKLGFNIEMVVGDNFEIQVDSFLSDRSDRIRVLRGTYGMIGANERLRSTPENKRPVEVVAMTHSIGDHMPVVERIKKISDLRGETIAAQKNGPHMDLVYEILKSGGLTFADVKMVWMENISGKGSAAELFGQGKADACLVVTPDMQTLTGGLKSVGTGAEGSVKGAHVLDSTAYAPQRILDTYWVRNDDYQANKEFWTKFSAGFLKGVEDVVLHKKTGDGNYKRVMDQLLAMYPDVLGNIAGADGLISDCQFLGHPGNVEFFTNPNYEFNFAYYEKNSLVIAKALGQAGKGFPLLAADFDWGSPVFMGLLTKTAKVEGPRLNAVAVRAELEVLSTSGKMSAQQIDTFTINFGIGDTTFDPSKHTDSFRAVLEMLKNHPRGAIAVRGHSDPFYFLKLVIDAGTEKNILQKTGNPGSYNYSVNGRPIADLSVNSDVVALVKSGAFEVPGRRETPRSVMQEAENLSLERAETVVKAIVTAAKSLGYRLDESQIHAQGVGIREPFVAKPRTPEDQQKNMRVEFTLVGMGSEQVIPRDFDY